MHMEKNKVEMKVSFAMLTYNPIRLVQKKGQKWIKKSLNDLILMHNWHYAQESDWWMSMCESLET